MKASAGSPPKRAGSVRRGMMSRNSNTDPGQPCSSSSGIGVGPDAGDTEVVQVDAVQRDAELREGVEHRLLPPPVEPGAPVLHEAAQAGDVGAEFPGFAGRLIRVAGAGEALAQIGNVGVGNVQRERNRIGSHV